MAKILAPTGEAGLSFMELAEKLEVTAACPQALATGEAGSVYFCHPFLVHAAQPHCGSVPRFVAQPSLFPAVPFQLDREDKKYAPVKAAIRLILGF